MTDQSRRRRGRRAQQQNLFGSKQSVGSCARRLRVESLEDRRLLALTVNTPILFTDLDQSLDDTDPSVGVVQILGNLTIQDGGSINANDNWAGSIPNDDAKPPIVINVSGNVLIEADTGAAHWIPASSPRTATRAASAETSR